MRDMFIFVPRTQDTHNLTSEVNIKKASCAVPQKQWEEDADEEEHSRVDATVCHGSQDQYLHQHGGIEVYRFHIPEVYPVL